MDLKRQNKYLTQVEQVLLVFIKLGEDSVVTDGRRDKYRVVDLLCEIFKHWTIYSCLNQMA